LPAINREKNFAKDFPLAFPKRFGFLSEEWRSRLRENSYDFERRSELIELQKDMAKCSKDVC
jgi:hypothetical protein